MRRRLELMISMIALTAAGVESMRLELRSGSSKCITEDLKSNVMTVGKYSLVNPNHQAYSPPDNHKINVRVTSPRGNNYHLSDQVESGTFGFTAAEEGDYVACFLAPHHQPSITLALDFDWKSGVAAKDWSGVAKKGQIEVMVIELSKLYETVITIHQEMFSLREREEEMQALNRATNSKMATFGVLSLLVCLSVAALQLWHLKTFFQSKKLL